MTGAGLQSKTPTVHGFDAITCEHMCGLSLLTLTNAVVGVRVTASLGDTEVITGANGRSRSHKEGGSGDRRKDCFGEHS